MTPVLILTSPLTREDLVNPILILSFSLKEKGRVAEVIAGGLPPTA